MRIAREGDSTGTNNQPPKQQIDVTLDLPVEAFIPRTYVPDMRTKIDLYRRLARVAVQSEFEELRVEFMDRFGPPPPDVDRLLLLCQLRIWAHFWQISAIHLEDGFIVFTYGQRQRIEQLVVRSRRRLRVVDEQSAYLPLPKEVSSPSQPILETGQIGVAAGMRDWNKPPLEWDRI